MDDSDKTEVVSRRHVVALPYPGRGHINPMINFCDQLISKDDKILTTFVVTEEWLSLLCGGSEPPSNNFNFRTLPNVVPSESIRAADILGFIEAVMTKMEAPFEQLLDRLEPPATMIMFDSFLYWVVGVGNRRNIPVASFWTMSAMVFSVFHHVPLLQQNGHYPIHDLSEKGGEVVDYIPGVSPTCLEDLPTILYETTHQSFHTRAFSQISKSQYLLLPTVSELESQAIQVLKRIIPIPIYSIGPSIPYPKLKITTSHDTDCFQWLEKQPCNSVLYVSMGSFLSFGRAQLDEISAGLQISGVRYLWIARDEAPRLMQDCCDDGENKGLVVPWCDQLRVLSHSSIGGFWTHCGWSLTQEGVFAGVPFLTLPLVMDQVSSSKLIVEDWKVGWKVKKKGNNINGVVYRNDIAELVKRFMDLESNEGKLMRGRARKLRQLSQQAVGKGGSSEANINAFIRDISKCP